MRVATERGKDTLKNSGVFLLQDLADLFIQGRKQYVLVRKGMRNRTP